MAFAFCGVARCRPAWTSSVQAPAKGVIVPVRQIRWQIRDTPQSPALADVVYELRMISRMLLRQVIDGPVTSQVLPVLGHADLPWPNLSVQVSSMSRRAFPS